MNYFRFIFAVLLVISFLTIAARAEDSEMHAMPMDPSLPTEGLQKDGFKVDSVNEKKSDKILGKSDREQLIKDSGLTDETAKWDALDRDVFTLRSANNPLERMRKWYPQLPEAKLKKHQELVAKYKVKKK